MQWGSLKFADTSQWPMGWTVMSSCLLASMVCRLVLPYEVGMLHNFLPLKCSLHRGFAIYSTVEQFYRALQCLHALTRHVADTRQSHANMAKLLPWDISHPSNISDHHPHGTWSLAALPFQTLDTQTTRESLATKCFLLETTMPYSLMDCGSPVYNCCNTKTPNHP